MQKAISEWQGKGYINFKLFIWWKCRYSIHIHNGSVYRTARGCLNLKPYSTTSCNVTVMHDKNAVGLVET